jgi:regulator of extracellular matrix RemA (YlzA/DUF370 family)
MVRFNFEYATLQSELARRMAARHYYSAPASEDVSYRPQRTPVINPGVKGIWDYWRIAAERIVGIVYPYASSVAIDNVSVDVAMNVSINDMTYKRMADLMKSIMQMDVERALLSDCMPHISEKMEESEYNLEDSLSCMLCSVQS